jgi:uncharacterized protein (TIGR02687 family)
MLKEKIQDYFQRYPALRILFFFDENEEYLEDVRSLEISDIQVEYYANNPFSLKCKLVDELKDSKVLLYLPMAHPNTQDGYHKFPLLGLLIANKELQLDNVGGFMEEFGLQRHQKSLVSRYIKELKYSGVQEVCRPILTAANFEEPALQRGLVSAFLKFKQVESWSVLVAKLIALSIEQENKDLARCFKKVQELNFKDEVIKRLHEYTGLSVQHLNQDAVREVGRSVLYNRIMQTMDATKSQDPYVKYKIKDAGHITRLNQMMQEAERNVGIRDDFEEAIQLAGKDIRGSKLIEVYGEETEFAEYNTEMIWAIVAKLVAHLSSSPAQVIKRLDSISLQSSIDLSVRSTLRYLVQVAKMNQYIAGMKGYILDRPEEYVQSYTQDWYKIDSSYRKAIASYKNLDFTEIPSSVNIDDIQAQLNQLYEKHTHELNREWLKCMAQFKFDYHLINVPKQYDFYKTEIANADQKVVVIISDALRYEAGVELLSEMHGDAKNTAEIRHILASIPSKTSIGMAQLLPGKEKKFNQGEIIVNSIASAGTGNRSKILQLGQSASRAIQYADLEGLGRPEVREIFKDNVVYVYHDVIDATGDKKSSERRTFEVVKDGIEELRRFVKLLHGSYNVAKVIITADHGFLYNDRELEEKDKEDVEVKDPVQSHNRYFITKEPLTTNMGYSFPLSSTTSFDDKLYVNIPASVNRYKKQGVGHQFVHGGGSLQELIVPLIESSRKRIEVTKKVTPMLIYKGGLKIVSNILKVNLLQEMEVSRLEKERTLKIALYSGSTKVSNEETVVLNFTSESLSDRMVRVELVLSGDAANESFLKLKGFDVEDMLNPVFEERVQNNTLIQPDF